MTSQLKKEDLLRAYRTMREIREFEDRLHIEFATGKIPGFVHLYSGEEAVATGVCMHLTDEDRISSTHRGHGHCIAKGVDIHGMMAEIYGKKTGTCGGKGGSMHIADLAKGMMGANGIVGAGPPLICGAALAAKFKGNGGVGVAFFGDGASNQGTILESMNLASIWKLPVIFLNENNGYAESTGVSYNVPTPNIADRAAGFGMPGVTVDGNDFFAVYEAAGEAIRRARAGEGPTLLECKTQRYFGHFEGDAMTYRPSGESQNLRKTRDCLKIFAEKVIAAGLVTAAELEAIDKEVLALIEDSVVKALAAPKPGPEDLLTGVYVSY
jgi:pyruvate dehydrogenase E1 component alpha subunit